MSDRRTIWYRNLGRYAWARYSERLVRERPDLVERPAKPFQDFHDIAVADWAYAWGFGRSRPNIELTWNEQAHIPGNHIMNDAEVAALIAKFEGLEASFAPR
jgi:hypothetical protein